MLLYCGLPCSVEGPDSKKTACYDIDVEVVSLESYLIITYA